MENVKLYRICTEATGAYAGTARALVQQAFPGFTELRGTGFWKGIRENSVVFEIVTDAHDTVLAVARDIREANGQQAVCVQVIDVAAVQVTA